MNLDLIHRPGQAKPPASPPDALSQRADHVPTGVDNDNIILLKSEWFPRIAVMRGQVEITGIGNELMEAIKKDDSRDEQVLQELGKRNPYWTKEGRVLLYKGLVYVPPTPELRTKVIEGSPQHAARRTPWYSQDTRAYYP